MYTDESYNYNLETYIQKPRYFTDQVSKFVITKRRPIIAFTNCADRSFEVFNSILVDIKSNKTFNCKCGYTLDRDFQGARNIWLKNQ